MTSPGTDPGRTNPEGADGEPKTLEPPRVMGVPRLRQHTMLGVAPPASSSKGPPATNATAEGPKRLNENEDEQTTMVGKLLAEAHAEVKEQLKNEKKETDLYADETATSVGDAQKLIATAHAAARAKIAAINGDDADEPTESKTNEEAVAEDVTSKRDAINIESTLAKAAELRAEAEARKQRAMKKRTMHGLGDGPLRLPERPPPDDDDDDAPTFDNNAPVNDEDSHAGSKRDGEPELMLPADGEPETLSAGAPEPAAMRSIHTEPETLQVPVPSTPRGRLETAPAEASTLLVANAPAPVPGVAFQDTVSVTPSAAPYTPPMAYAPTMRMDDDSGPVDPLRATVQSPGGPGGVPHPPPSPQLAMSPPGGVPHYHSTPMPVPAPAQYSMQPHPHAGPAAFARTAIGTTSEPRAAPKKKSRAGLVFFLFVLAAFGGVGYWQRGTIRAMYIAYRYPPPAAEPSSAPSETASSTPPVASDAPAASESASASPSASASASASPPASASASASPPASSSAAPRASASATTKTPTKKPAWKPPPKKSTSPKSLPVPKPVDDGRGF